MHEQSKAAKRRVTQPAFLTRYFVGDGIDIGAGPDGLSKYVGIFPLLRAVRDWDLPDGDAQYLPGVPDGSVDFVHASHCLEHLRDPRVALANWLRVVRPGGHIVVTVPDEDMYERGVWPSRRNSDHKWTFTAAKRESWSPVSVSLIDLAHEFADQAELERLEVLRDFFRPDQGGDQTLGPVAECAIELVLKRRPALPAPAPMARSLIPPLGRLRLKSCAQGLLLFDPASEEGAALDRYGEYLEPLAGALTAMLRPGDLAVSFGGIGTLALAMARRVASGGAVRAVAGREEFALLSANATLNELPELRPLPAPVTLDALALPSCRLVVGRAEDLAGADLTLARHRPLLCLAADRPEQAAGALAVAERLGYAAFWHVAARVRARNCFGQAAPADAAPSARLMLAPPAIALAGLLPAQGADWRADMARARR